MGEDPRPLEAVVNEVVAEAHLRPEELRPEERAYLKEHALKKPLRVLDIWALGVGVVITDEYFGWNFGLVVGGPLGVLIASLIVCVLYLTWVLTLSELSISCDALRLGFGVQALACAERHSLKAVLHNQVPENH